MSVLKSRAILVISCYIANHSNIQGLRIKIVLLLSLLASAGREFRKVSAGRCWPWSHAVVMRQWREQRGAGCASCFRSLRARVSTLGTWALRTAWQSRGSGTAFIRKLQKRVFPTVAAAWLVVTFLLVSAGQGRHKSHPSSREGDIDPPLMKGVSKLL